MPTIRPVCRPAHDLRHPCASYYSRSVNDGGIKRRDCLRHLPLHVHACFEDGDRIAPLGYRVVGDPGLVEGQQSELPEGVGGICRCTPGSAGEAETLVSVVGRSYERWSKVFLSVPPDQRQTVFDLSQMALLEAGKHLSDHAESDDAAQAGDETAVDDDEPSTP